MNLKYLPLGLMFFLSACATHQSVNPVRDLNPEKICVIENDKVKHNFLGSYVQALSDRGFEVAVQPPLSSVKVCDWSSTYSARWNWDLALYMIEAKIRVFKGGALVGEASYDSHGAGLNFDKFIDADDKIRELVSKVFPSGFTPAGN